MFKPLAPSLGCRFDPAPADEPEVEATPEGLPPGFTSRDHFDTQRVLMADLERVRKELRLSAYQFAKTAGIDAPLYSRCRNLRQAVSMNFLMRFCVAYGLRPRLFKAP